MYTTRSGYAFFFNAIKDEMKEVTIVEVSFSRPLRAPSHVRAETLETLAAFATILASSKPFQDKSGEALMVMKVLGEGDMAALRVSKQDESGLAVLACSGTGLLEDEPVPLLSYDQSISTLAYQCGETVVANDYAVHPRAVPSVVAKGIQSVIALPLKISDRMVGIVSLTSAHKNHFRPERVHLLTAVSSAMGLFIDHARLLDEVQVQTRHLSLANIGLRREMIERKQAENALRETADKLHLLTEALPVLIAYLDANQRYCLVNKTYEEWCRLPRSIIYGSQMAEVLGTETYQIIQRHIETVLIGQTVNFEDTLLYRDGKRRDVYALYVPHFNATGNVQGFFELVNDLSERRKTEQALRNAEHFASLGRLAAGLTHEIRNPLSAIFLSVDILSEEFQQPSPDSQAQIGDLLTEIKLHLSRVENLVQEYLSLVRLAVLQREPEDLGAFVEAFVREIEQPLTAHGIVLHLEGLASLGHVSLHRASFRRVLLNLIQNARDAMPQGGTLSLRGWHTASHIYLEVHDTGIGMPDDLASSAFEPFRSTKPGGTGLGLHLVQEIVRAHEGHIEVQTKVGHGTTFTVALPCLYPGETSRPNTP